ncbi:uncharacterized protein N7515_006130 [Penicillium bovifimosum]|uniref:Galactose oxidase/kelch, beta-propeller n=1 Tax=Penicillium bovifimosum TaxID=126998 RepID=A0A9W9GVH3_9EURO|nr:uncharacterized protein N7515_006130 [Penicillium bovifimosum]KAJ5130091.1 hypothetical protein N7515_006130 [Penicillium bovifimosum]
MSMKHRKALLALLALFDPSSAIPYPTSSVFLSAQHNNSLAYILQPSASGETEFLSLNLSSSIDTHNLSYNTLLKSTPFHNDEQNSSFIPAVDDQGRITVYTGNCHSVSDDPILWKFQPDSANADGNGTWNKAPVIARDTEAAPNYLAAGFTFSSSSNPGESAMYVFGGMCPFKNSTDSTWVSAANYSQSMVMLGPHPYYSTKHRATITGTRATPIAEAGMAVVPLPPSYTVGSKLKQQDFLFIGGHTREAFLNMSQLAVFSLPQQSWSFVSAVSDSELRTELAVRDVAPVEPRSGHTAVLSEDGTKVYVVGGWVGNETVPADPQFAVLDLAEGLGGANDWTWMTPSSEGLGIPEGAGIFGHGAAMLPGGVMMIHGGYSIPKSSSKRASMTAQSNSQVHLYNVTSNSWITSYRNPAAKSSIAPATHNHKLSSSQKAGIGVSLGIGLPAIIVIALCTWNYHRKRRVKSKRDSQLRELALGAERAHFWDQGDQAQASSIRSSRMSEKRGASGYYRSTNRGQATPSGWNDQGEAAAERTELLGDQSSPVKNSRPPVMPPVNRRVSSRRGDAVSDISPIYEREEDDAGFQDRLMATVPRSEETTTGGPEDSFANTPYATPRSTIFGVGLGPFYSRRKDIDSVEPEFVPKSERTTTDLSDRSAYSFEPSQPAGRVLQTRAMFADRPLSWGSGRQSLEYQAEASAPSVPDGRAPSETSVSADSFSTAPSKLSHRQSENESLLFDAFDPLTPLTPIEPSSPSKLPRESKPKASDWVMNTMRRALTLSRHSPDDKPDLSFGDAKTAHRASGIDRRSTILESGQQTPGSGSGISSPRRAVSASAELFRRKQGAKDWNARKRASENVFDTGPSTYDDIFVGAPGYLGNDVGDDDDEADVHDWDVEGAAAGRRVQVAFTVPKERLRVVNATAGDMDGISERSVSGGNGNRRVSH